MAPTLAIVQAQLAALREALGTGQLRVAYADKSVQYRTLDEMFITLRWLEGEEAKLLGVAPAPSQVRMITGDGYDDGTDPAQ